MQAPLAATLTRWFKLRLAATLVERPAFWAHAQRRRSMPVLCYHRIDDQADALGLAVSRAEFAHQMQALAESPHLRPVSAAEYLEIWQGRRRYGPGIPVLVSFDDGFRDNLTEAAPVLKRHGVPAILFVATDLLQGRPPWYDLVERMVWAGQAPALWHALKSQGLIDNKTPLPAGASALVDALLALDGARFAAAVQTLNSLPSAQALAQTLGSRYLDAPGLLEWAAAGLEVGAHTCTHPRLTALTSAAVDWEMAKSKRQLETLLGRPVLHFAYPFGRQGDFTADHARAAARLGYAMAFTTLQGSNQVGDDAFGVRRKCVNSGLFSRPGQAFSSALFFADLMGLGADLKRGLTRTTTTHPCPSPLR